MADLTTYLGGLELRSPLILASGPLSYDGEAILRAHRAGIGAVVTKTIRQDAARNPVPHIARLSGALLNSEKWSDLPARAWIEEELPRAKEGGATVIASVGLEAKQVRLLARALEMAGADALEVCSYDASEVVPMVAAAVREVEIPVLAKVSANWHGVVGVAESALRAGAAGITAIDSVGPALRLDVERRAPILGGGVGWLSGPTIYPIALRVVAEIAGATRAPIVGTGGVESVDDIIEMLMAGACAVGVCSHLIVTGLRGVDRWLQGLSARLDELGIERIEHAIGAALPALAACRADAACFDGREERAGKLAFVWSADLCTRCNLCVRVCPYEARTAPSAIEPDRCRICGLCASACPTRALRLVAETGDECLSEGRGEGGNHAA